MVNFNLGAVIGLVLGGAIIWVSKDWLIKMTAGAESLKARLQASIDALKK